MSDSTFGINLRSPHTATINLAASYSSVQLDAGKRISLFDARLVAYVERTADYATNPASRNAANELSPRPVLLHPTVAIGTTAAAITLHNIHITDYQCMAASILILSDKIYNGVSPDDKDNHGQLRNWSSQLFPSTMGNDGVPLCSSLHSCGLSALSESVFKV